MPARAERSPERLVFFSDAVVAIAVTLLILPLADAVPEAVAKHTDSVELITENWWKIFSFLLSFFVITRLWRVHHRLFEDVKAIAPGLMETNAIWLLAIVVLPFPTEMVSGYGNDPFTQSFYIATILVATICELVMVAIARRMPGLADDSAERLDGMLVGTAASGIALIIAFALGFLLPAMSYYPLLLLLLIGPAQRIRTRLRKNRATA